MGALVLRKSIATGLIAACVLFAVPASALAADLGGDCCADLEERIAELEATTARKGNRKVSLTVSGWVTQQVMFWDDGKDDAGSGPVFPGLNNGNDRGRNVYVHDLGSTLGSHFKFSGQANFAPGWDAGYTLHIGAISSDGLRHGQDTDNGPSAIGDNVHILQSYWFIRSETLGKLSLGRQSQASDNTAILADGSGSAISANWVAFDVASFRLRRTNDGSLPGINWADAGGCHFMGGAWGDCNGLPRNVVRYDSPTFGGFSASASWGEDDMWDVAARYADTWGDFKVALAAAYAETTDEDMGGRAHTLIAIDGLEYFQAGAYFEHVPTGLFAYGAYGKLRTALPADIFGGFEIPESVTYYAKGGVRQRWSSLGATVLYGEYLRNSDGFFNDIEFPVGSGTFGPFTFTVAGQSKLDMWGLGLVQEIDAAAMSVWIKYRRMSFDVDATLDGFDLTGGTEYEDFQYIGAGAIIHF